MSYCDSDDYDDQTFYYEDALEQETSLVETIYSGDLLISEIINQDSTMHYLASGSMLIADIDCGQDIDKPLERLTKYVHQNGGCFKVYKTKNGMRYFQTDLLYQGVNKSAISTLQQLGSDPKYINLCHRGGRFMARLTPKIDSKLALKYFQDIEKGDVPEICVCHYLKTISLKRSFLSLLRRSVEIHDLITQSNMNFELL